MKQIKFILFFVFLALTVLFAQQKDTSSRQNGFSIKINPLQLAFGEARLLFEKPISKQHALEFIGSYFFNYTSTPEFEHFDWRSGFKAGISYRYYFYYSNSDEYKTYLNPLFFYKYIDYKNAIDGPGAAQPGTFFKHVYSLQLQLGNIIFENKHIIIDRYIGVGIRYVGDSSTDIHESDFELRGKSIHVGINIGFKSH